jgi:hypothetical protein
MNPNNPFLKIRDASTYLDADFALKTHMVTVMFGNGLRIDLRSSPRVPDQCIPCDSQNLLVGAQFYRISIDVNQQSTNNIIAHYRAGKHDDYLRSS